MGARVVGAQKGLQPARKLTLAVLLRKLDISSSCERYLTCRLINLLAPEPERAQRIAM